MHQSTHFDLDLFVLYDSNGDGFLAGDEIGRLAHGSAAAMRSLLRSLAPDQQPTGLPQTPAEKETSEKVCTVVHSLCRVAEEGGGRRD